MSRRSGYPLLALFTALLVAFSLLQAPPAHAANVTDGFDPGNIISDENFYSGSAMSASQVQTFLNQRVPRCTIGDAGRAPGSAWGSTRIANNCLRDFRVTTQSRAANAYCNAYSGVANESAASIIARVGQACGISQRVLLIMLEKEQSLVTDTWPTVRQFDVAMGYACPDSGPGGSANCDSAYYGFFNQVYRAAWQLKVYRAHPNSYNYKPFQNNRIQWHPNAGCGTSNVYIQNWATAALYIYTPYRPNQAALNAGWGTGDGCSSYGNRNFYNFYKTWFGDPKGFQVTGAALQTWNRFGGAGGTLGSPIENAQHIAANGGGYVQRFTKGVIFVENRTGKSTAMTNGPFLRNYQAAGYVQGKWAWPTADATCRLAAGGCTMPFQTGIVAYSAATGSHLVPTELVAEWNRLSGVNGLLKYPTSEPMRSASGVAQMFQGGLSMATKAGAFTFNPEVSNAWSEQGAMKGFGLIDGTVERLDGGRYYVPFEHAHLYVTPGASTVRFGSGAFLREYEATGASEGPWGWPSEAGICNALGTCTMNFEHGQAVYTQATGVSFLTSRFHALWAANGGFRGSLRYPIGSEVAYANGAMHRFQGGNLVVGPKATVRFGGGAFLREWEANGGPNGPWGWPLAAGVCDAAGACTMNFEHGQAVYTQAAGVSFLTPRFQKLWEENGGAGGSLRYPVGAEVAYANGAMHRFQGGNLVVGPKATVRFGGGAFLREWEANGGPNGPWGWPLAVGVCDAAGACTMSFERGQAVYSAASGVEFRAK